MECRVEGGGNFSCHHAAAHAQQNDDRGLCGCAVLPSGGGQVDGPEEQDHYWARERWSSGSIWQLIASYYEVYSNAGNQAETLTGRLGIWAFVLTRAVEQPWIGHGFHSFRNVIPPFGSFEAWHAHNELLQQFYTYGVLGIVLLVGIYGSFLRYVRRTASAETRAVLTSLLVFVVMRGLGDTENFDLSLPLWFIALMSLTLAQGGERRVGTTQEDEQPGLARLRAPGAEPLRGTLA